MPQRDDPTGSGLTRRAALRGAAAACLLPSTALATPAPIRVGLVGGLGLSPAAIDAASRRLFGRPAALVAFASWGALRDHAAARHGIQAAVLPGGSSGIPLTAPTPAARLLLPIRPASPLDGRSRGLSIGVALNHAGLESAAREWLGPGCRLIVLAPAALAANVAAGLLDGALVVADEPAAGLQSVPAPASVSSAMLPRLALVPGGATFAQV